MFQSAVYNINWKFFNINFHFHLKISWNPKSKCSARVCRRSWSTVSPKPSPSWTLVTSARVLRVWRAGNCTPRWARPQTPSRHASFSCPGWWLRASATSRPSMDWSRRFVAGTAGRTRRGCAVDLVFQTLVILCTSGIFKSKSFKK